MRVVKVVLFMQLETILLFSHIATPPPNARYPDVIALSFDENSQKITCIYKDNSMYIWDVQDIKRVGKSKSFLYHSSCIRGVDVSIYIICQM